MSGGFKKLILTYTRTDGQTDRRADGQGLIDSSIHKLSENIYFMGSEMKVVEITNGMTKLYIPLCTTGEGYKKGQQNVFGCMQIFLIP